MRRIAIYIEDELDDFLQAEAARKKCSKSSLIRECLRLRYKSLGAIQSDPITALVGSIDAEPCKDIDEAIYGR